MTEDGSLFVFQSIKTRFLFDVFSKGTHHIHKMIRLIV